MKSFACFNELSISPLCASESAVERRIRRFLEVLRDVRKCAHITKVRHNSDMTTIMMTDCLSLQDYINNHTTDVVVRALLGVFTHPQVDMADDVSLQNYFDTKTSVILGDGGRLESADGFNAAYCQNTFCVGFESGEIWQKDFFDLEIISNGKSKNVTWVCVSSPFESDCECEDINLRKQKFNDWLKERNVELVESEFLPEQKSIKVDGDHGQFELKEHAEKLVRNRYVDGVLTSLKFRPKCRDYVFRITDDGLVDVVLFWEDAGYSMRIKTTGRNVAETSEIANLLRKEYGKGR